MTQRAKRQGSGNQLRSTPLSVMAEQGVAMVYDTVHMVLAQGDMALAVSEGTFGDAPTSYYDLWRVEDGKIAGRYAAFLDVHKEGRVLYLELGVGGNTPVIVKYPFWRMTHANPDATYACVNYGEAFTAREIVDRSILVDGDIDTVLDELLEVRHDWEAQA